jgi:hypothetical protein
MDGSQYTLLTHHVSDLQFDSAQNRTAENNKDIRDPGWVEDLAFDISSVIWVSDSQVNAPKTF